MTDQKLGVLEKQFIFIIGSPRSGTTWLQTMLAAHPQVCTTVELTLFTYYIKPWIQIWKAEAENIAQGRWHAGLPFLWTEDEFYGFLKEFLQRVYGRVLNPNPQATHILDKHPGYSFDIEDINDFLPHARFLHIIRDGRDVAVSMVAAYHKLGFGTGTVRDSAIEWKRHINSARIAQQYGNRYLEVRYELLLNSGIDVLKTVFDFCDLQVTTAEIAKIVKDHEFQKMRANALTPNKNVKAPDGAYRKGQIGSWQEELEPIQRYLFDRIAGDLLQELGYAQDGWWADTRFQHFFLPLGEMFTRRWQVFKYMLATLLGSTTSERIGRILMKCKRKSAKHQHSSQYKQ